MLGLRSIDRLRDRGGTGLGARFDRDGSGSVDRRSLCGLRRGGGSLHGGLGSRTGLRHGLGIRIRYGLGNGVGSLVGLRSDGGSARRGLGSGGLLGLRDTRLGVRHGLGSSRNGSIGDLRVVRDSSPGVRNGLGRGGFSGSGRSSGGSIRHGHRTGRLLGLHGLGLRLHRTLGSDRDGGLHVRRRVHDGGSGGVGNLLRLRSGGGGIGHRYGTGRLHSRVLHLRHDLGRDGGLRVHDGSGYGCRLRRGLIPLRRLGGRRLFRRAVGDRGGRHRRHLGRNLTLFGLNGGLLRPGCTGRGPGGRVGLG
ncbi:hypothetical protein V7793_37550, partial [Streptomyces sp. KLMMK]